MTVKKCSPSSSDDDDDNDSSDNDFVLETSTDEHSAVPLQNNHIPLHIYIVVPLQDAHIAHSQCQSQI